jgi:hypothetical protein
MEAGTMNLRQHIQVRNEARRSRRPPDQERSLVADFENGGDLPNERIAGPIRLTIEATSPAGELAAWFHDDWWTAVLQQYADEAVTVQVLATPGALLHPVVLHEMTMLRRVVPRWRIIGQAHLDDLRSEDDVAQAAQSPYHEIHLLDQRCAEHPPRATPGTAWSIDELTTRIRSHQRRLNLTSPAVLPAPAPEFTGPLADT